MKKLRSDSSWRSLSAAQQQALEGWLFEENLGYSEVLERAQKEFGVTASISSLAAHYKRLLCQRKLKSYDQIHDWHTKTFADINPHQFLQTHLLNLIHVTAFEMAIGNPEKIKINDLATLMHILNQNRRQENREQRLSLEKEQLEAEFKINLLREVRAQIQMQDQRVAPSPEVREIYFKLAKHLQKGLFEDEPAAKKPAEGEKTPA